VQTHRKVSGLPTAGHGVPLQQAQHFQYFHTTQVNWSSPRCVARSKMGCYGMFTFGIAGRLEIDGSGWDGLPERPDTSEYQQYFVNDAFFGHYI
jgi:hypothetical protein